MDKIKEYLNNLFIGLPETPAVLRAKAELLEMMEDKYDELISEGKNETEAFGTVISEFGNLEELADALGIKEQISDSKDTDATENIKDEKEQNGIKAEEIWDEAKMNTFLGLMWKRAKMMALGVALFIAFPAITSIFESLVENVSGLSLMKGGITVLLFFGTISAGVLLCVQSGHILKTFGYNKRRRVGLSVQAAEALKSRREAESKKLYYMLIAGVLLCVYSILPSAIFDPSNRFLAEIVSASFLLFVAAGVYLLVARASVLNRYKEFSKSKLYNESQTNEINADYFVESKPKRMSGVGLAAIIVSIFLVIGIVVVMILAAFFGAIKTAGNLAKNVLETEIVYQEEELTDLGNFSISETDKMVINGDAVNVKVSKSDDGQIHVKYYGRGTVPEISQKGSKLVINCKKSGKKIGINLARNIEDMIGTIYVEIPNVSGELDFEYNIEASKIVMDNISVDRILFDTDASAITLNTINANALSVKMDAGALKMEDCIIKDFCAEVDATSINASNTSLGNADINVDAGDIDIETAEGCDCYGFDVETDLASVKIGGLKVSGDYKSEAKDTSKGAHFIKIDSDVASIQVR